ncbi:primary-amine oxidase [Rhizobium sp. WW_1]|jgi:primary-amine oxidase|uniref:primary-amine oxidase n=1 Tax=Rhizobium sp. WW_1 TaxID=1907375 RepID=UPI0006489563|nr:primary-amine oxidase [Rhizobium sp. WW_1]RKD67914.1 primary-amine oxidase [Rhizobium sp. WW_1]
MNQIVHSATTQTSAAAPPPPAYLKALSPLSADEIRAVTAVIKADPELGPDILFENIDLREPTPSEHRAHLEGQTLPRQARVNVNHLDRPGVWQLIVSLADKSIVSRKHFPTARAGFMVEQMLSVEVNVKNDPRFVEACRKRGIEDMTGVIVDSWSGGNFGHKDEEGRLISHTFSWLRVHEFGNYYAHPIEGLNAVIDVKTGEVLRVDDYPDHPPIPMTRYDYDPEFLPAPSAPLKTLDVVQPDGVSFTIDGHAIAWDKWTLAIGFTPREGLVLHDIRFDGRSVVRRAAIAELVVPYGSPLYGHARQNIFDVGEYGFGKLTNSLKLGCDCLGTIHYLDAEVNGINGEPVTIEKAVCIHEEDAGVLWKHWDFRTGRTVLKRGRKLVISSICTVGNYEYAQYWYLDLAGEIEFEMKATGIVNTNACHPGQPDKYSTEIQPGLGAPIHQHIFCARLDVAVDGSGNSVVETNSFMESTSDTNPYGNAFHAEDTVLKTELGAARRADLSTHRSWKVINPSKLNHVGKPVGYKLHAPNCVTPMIQEDGPSGIRSNFIRNHIWVTPYDENERYPAGEFVANSDGSGGLAEIIKQDRPVENTDIVLWHSFGLHHVVRPEDFPVQPCISCGFSLAPAGFFEMNPSNNLPNTINNASVLATDGSKGCCC